MTPFALKARWVLPITGPPIDGGVVTIADGRIIAVGVRPDPDVQLQDLGDVALMPGFVNAHTHLEFSGLASPLGRPGMPLPEWIRLVIGSRKQRDESASGLRQGLVESANAGVTTLGDIATTSFPTDVADPTPELLAFQEVIGFSEARIDSVYAELVQRLTSQTTIPLGISPHAPYTVHPQLIERLVELAANQCLPVAMHLAESREELELLRENSGPFRDLLEERSMWDDKVFASKLRPLDYLKLLARAPRALVVHGNYLEQDEWEFVAANEQMSIVYCPRTHAFFAHDEYPLIQMLDCGVNVAIGTDSRASNPDLSLLEELRFVLQTFSNIGPDIILRLGTLGGAQALGLNEHVGSLEVGKLANLTTVDCAEAISPHEAILCSTKPPMQTWIQGQLVNASC